MIIRKKFTITNTHIVRNCYSSRCKYSLHTHTAEIECFWEATGLDNAFMVMDFGVVKQAIKPFLEAFDEAVLLWNRDNVEYRDFVKNITDKWIELPFTPSAEMLAAMFTLNFDSITSQLLEKGLLKNSESSDLHYIKTIYHETRTGYAEATPVDAMRIFMDMRQCISAAGFKFGPHPDLYVDKGAEKVIRALTLKDFNPVIPEQQVKVRK